MKDIWKPRGRRARAEQSSRAGSFWDSEITPIYVGPDKREYTAIQMYKRFGSSKMAKSEPIKTIFTRRKHCGQNLEMDHRGFAFCPSCSKIFNAGDVEDDDTFNLEIKPGVIGPPGSVFPCSEGRAASLRQTS
jgi:hypothetical protein